MILLFVVDGRSISHCYHEEQSRDTHRVDAILDDGGESFVPVGLQNETFAKIDYI